MKQLTAQEKRLLIETVETSTYAGRLAHLVAGILDKLKEVKEPKK
jgi:hypothetical protein